MTHRHDVDLRPVWAILTPTHHHSPGTPPGHFLCLRPGGPVPQQVTLADNVHDLTRRHIRKDGPTKGQWEDALLDQLQEAVTSLGNNGGKSSSETASPVNIRAMDVQRKIANDVRDLAYKRQEDADRPVVDILRGWAGEPDRDLYLTHVTLDIIDTIREAIEPQVKPIPLDQACPDASCGKRRVRERDETGAWVKRPALVVHCRDEHGKGIAITDWTARCSACGREWHGAQELAWLGRMLDTPERGEVVTTM